MAKPKNVEPKKERWYYKDKATGKAAYSLKEPLSNILEDTSAYVEITKEEWDELTYVAPVAPVEPTAEELAEKARVAEIAQLKAQLAQTDYCIIKIAEGVATFEEYAEVIAQRAQWRARINELEGE